MAAAGQGRLVMDVIKQYPGPAQAQRKVRVKVPAKHFLYFLQLSSTESRRSRTGGTAVELAERPKFPQHLRQGAARTDAGIRFICEADTIDDPDSKVTARASGQRWRCGTAGATRPIGTILRERSSSWTSCLPQRHTGSGR